MLQKYHISALVSRAELYRQWEIMLSFIAEYPRQLWVFMIGIWFVVLREMAFGLLIKSYA